MSKPKLAPMTPPQPLKAHATPGPKAYPACSTCRHWSRLTAAGNCGDCRRYPPALAGSATWNFPLTNYATTCGEFSSL